VSLKKKKTQHNQCNNLGKLRSASQNLLPRPQAEAELNAPTGNSPPDPLCRMSGLTPSQWNGSKGFIHLTITIKLSSQKAVALFDLGQYTKNDFGNPTTHTLSLRK